MASVIIMPKQGLLMEEGTITKWLAKEGEQTTEGAPLFEMETDKLTITMDSTATGTVLKILHPEGDTVPITQPIAIVGQPGEDISGLLGGEAPAAAPAAAAPEAPTAEAAPAPQPVVEHAPGERVFSSPRARLRAEENGVDIAAVPGSGPDGLVVERDVQNYIANQPAVTPLAANQARAQGIDLSGVTGTGPNGRIIERDIDKLLASGAAAAYAAPTAAAPAAAEFEDVKWSPVRKATAKSMTKSLSTMAQLTQQYSFDATQIQAYRAMLKPLDAPMGKVSLNDMVMFAVAKTIKSCPDLNANMVEDNVIRHFSHVNLGFACDTPRGLLVPTIFHADEMSLLELSMEAKRLAAAARDGSLSPDEMTGATFTVTNIGSFGCEAFTPVVNPPQIGILGVCNIQTKIKSAKDGMIETYPAMGLSLTFDHRALDGAPAARYMSELCKSLESFMTLMAK